MPRSRGHAPLLDSCKSFMSFFRKKSVRWTVRAMAGLFLVVLLLVAVVVIWEWTYLKRAFTYPENPVTRIDWYEPKESIPGSPGASLPSARPEEVGISAEALAKVAEYCERKNSAGLVIVRVGEQARDWDDAFIPNAVLRGIERNFGK